MTMQTARGYLQCKTEKNWDVNNDNAETARGYLQCKIEKNHQT